MIQLVGGSGLPNAYVVPHSKILQLRAETNQFVLFRFSLRLFQHTFGTPPSNLYQQPVIRDSFHSGRTGECLGSTGVL